MRCPGQDTRYWTGEVAFDVACPKCGSQVELFKDEGSVRCPHCRHKFQNPRMSFDCAQWCAYAEQCVGFVPEKKAPANAGEGVLASRLIQAVKEEYANDASRLASALSTFQHARELLSKEGGDPRTILAGAVLLETGSGEGGLGQSEGADAAGTCDVEVATRILKEIGFDQDAIACVCRILEAYGTNRDLDTIEFKVVSDARVLASLSQIEKSEGGETGNRPLKRKLNTEAGRQKARSMA